MMTSITRCIPRTPREGPRDRRPAGRAESAGRVEGVSAPPVGPGSGRGRRGLLQLRPVPGDRAANEMIEQKGYSEVERFGRPQALPEALVKTFTRRKKW